MSLNAQTIPCRTRDGVELALRRIHDPDLGQSRPSRGAIVMQHGLGSNGLGFDVPGRSLSRRLAELGYDCFLPELRGAGKSEKPKTPYGLDEYLEQDVPAIIDAARQASGRPTVSWIGHSMGGILPMLYGIEHPDAPIDRIITIASTLDYRPGYSVHKDMRKTRWLAGNWLKSIPFGMFSRWCSLVAGSGPLFPPEKINFWRSNMDRVMMRHVLKHGFTPIPMLLLDDLATVFDDAGISRRNRSPEGKLQYLPIASRFRIPILLLSGSGDAQCSAAAVDEAARLLAGGNPQVAHFGKPHGHSDHYGHFDLIIGKQAETEVWPTITRFLEAV